VKKRIAVLAALAMANLAGCASVVESDGIVLPFAAVGVVSFKDGGLSEPRAARVNAQVAQLLDEHERAQQHGSDPRLVAAR
jgi:hypothetical protein